MAKHKKLLWQVIVFSQLIDVDQPAAGTEFGDRAFNGARGNMLQHSIADRQVKIMSRQRQLFNFALKELDPGILSVFFPS